MTAKGGGKMVREFFFAGALCLLGTDAGRAQYIDQTLRGTTSFDLVIEDLNDAARACGLTEAEIKRVFMSTVSGTGLRIDDAESQALFAITVIVALTSKGCASAVNMRAERMGWVNFSNLNSSDGLSFGMVLMWDDNWVGVSDPADHPYIISREIEEMAGRFIDDWKAQRGEKARQGGEEYQP
jgi:hypothetical protein